MPLRHTKSGWMWGSKGPFPTKAKALSVARAAYANGYKGDGEKNTDKLQLVLESKFPCKK
jgi:hypothetical protein